MKINTGANALPYNLSSLGISATNDAFGFVAGGTGSTSASQISSLGSVQSLALQAEINSQHAALPSGTSSPATDTGGSDVHSMTNAQLMAYAKANGLSDVTSSFQVDYAPMDRSAAGETAFYQGLMSDPTKYDFVQEYREAAAWQARHGASDHGASFIKMADELTDTANKKTNSV